MLIIEKVIKLLSESYFDTFSQYLERNNHQLSKSLIHSIRNNPLATTEDYCFEIYGSRDEKSKKRFLQLAHQTLKHTSHLARTCPHYLSHNFTQLEAYAHSEQYPKAVEMAEMLLDVSTKIEDFQTQIRALKFLGQRAHVLEQMSESIRYHELIAVPIEHERLYNDIYIYLRKHFNTKIKTSPKKPNTQAHLNFFDQYRNHECVSIQILARHGYMYVLSFLNDEAFFSEDSVEETERLTKYCDKYAYVLLPYADDILINIDYHLIKQYLYLSNEKPILKTAINLSKKWTNQRFWKGYYNLPEVVSYSIQASYFLTAHLDGYKHKDDRTLPKDVRAQLASIRKAAETALARPIWEEKSFHLRYINLSNIYCCMLLLGDEDDFKKVVQIIEGILIRYQQVSFQRLYDALFTALILAYFQLADYYKVEETYKRYEKLTRHQAKMSENDLTIKAFYYAAQWLSTKRPQYARKLHFVRLETEQDTRLTSTLKNIDDLIAYFNVPNSKRK